MDANDQQMEWILNEIGKAVVLKAQMLAPFDTGDLSNRNMIEYEVNVKEGKVIIRNKSPYAEYVEYGTGMYGENMPPHMITAKHLTEDGKPGFLRFKADGSHNKGEHIPGNIAFEKDGFIFTQKTRGMKPHPFMRRAIHQSEPIIEQIIADGLKR